MTMDTVWFDIKSDYVDKIREICAKKLQDAYQLYLKERIQNGYYEKGGGYRKFQRDFECLKVEYESAVQVFPQHEILWTWFGFVTKMKETETKILQTDVYMSQWEKKEEQSRKNIENDLLLKEYKETQIDLLYQQRRDLRVHYKNLKKDRLQQLEIERQKFETFVQEKLKQDKPTAQKEIKKYAFVQETKMQRLENESYAQAAARIELDQYKMKQDEKLQKVENEGLKQVQEALQKNFERYEFEQKAKMQKYESEMKQHTTEIFEKYIREQNIEKERFENKINGRLELKTNKRENERMWKTVTVKCEQDAKESNEKMKKYIHEILEKGKEEKTIGTTPSKFSGGRETRYRTVRK